MQKVALIQKLTYADFLTDYFLESFALKRNSYEIHEICSSENFRQLTNWQKMATVNQILLYKSKTN